MPAYCAPPSSLHEDSHERINQSICRGRVLAGSRVDSVGKTLALAPSGENETLCHLDVDAAVQIGSAERSCIGKR